jgi:hypothetical protein
MLGTIGTITTNSIGLSLFLFNSLQVLPPSIHLLTALLIIIVALLDRHHSVIFVGRGRL